MASTLGRSASEDRCTFMCCMREVNRNINLTRKDRALGGSDMKQHGSGTLEYKVKWGVLWGILIIVNYQDSEYLRRW